MQELISNLGIDWRLLIAQAVNFLLVLWLLNRFVFKKIIRYLEERKKSIEQGLELRESAERQIGQISEARQRELQKATQEGEKIVAQARSIAIEKEKAAKALARAEAEKIMLKAKEGAEKEKKEAVLEVKGEIQKLAALIAEKILERSVRKEDQEEAAKEVMDYFKKGYAK